MGIRYRPEIDGLRAIAVLAVVLYHAGIGAAGFVGVDIFFVISGYLITSLLLDERESTGRIDLFAFYARRVRRIVPAAMLVIVATLIVAYGVLDPPPSAAIAQSAAASLAFVANVFFQFNTGGYWDAVAEEMPLLHLWSLSVEEQFYLLWPALLVFTRSRKVMLVGAVASLLLAEWWIAQNADAAFYEMPARFWELAIGGLVAASRWRMPSWTSALGVVITLVACIVPATAHFPGIGAAPAVLGAALVCAGGSNRFLASKPMVSIGLISYSLYLWHWPLLAFHRATAVGEGSLQVRLVLCAVALLLAMATYRYIETPFRKMRYPPRRTVLAGAALSIVLASSALIVGARPLPEPARDPFPLATQAERDLPPIRCGYNVGDVVFPKCPVTARNAVWGDSLAFAWRPYAEQLGDVADFSRQGCGPFLGWLPAKAMPADEKCRDFNAKAVGALRGMDVVVIAARWNAERLPAFEDSLAAVAPHVGRVILIGPSPELAERVPKCIRQRIDCDLARQAFDGRARPILRRLHDLAKPYPNVDVVDVSDLFCNARTCPVIVHGAPAYSDRYHPTTTLVRRLSPLTRDDAFAPDR